MIRIYTDGGYSIPKGVGGYAFVVVDGIDVVHTFHTTEKNSTNSRMEIKAFLGALRYAKEHYPNQEVTMYTDNQYVVRGYNEWMKGWKAKGWRKADGKEIMNRDLWEQIDQEKSPLLISKWVRGHNGDEYNELVDSLTRGYM